MTPTVMLSYNNIVNLNLMIIKHRFCLIILKMSSKPDWLMFNVLKIQL